MVKQEKNDNHFIVDCLQYANWSPKIFKEMRLGGEYSMSDLTSLFDNSVNEPIFFIIREMCFGNEDYLVKGDWSNPNSLVIQKTNT